MTTPTNPLTPQTVQRLAFIRYLHEMGVAQSAQPEPLSATAILCFQDAVEHFLLLSADHLKVNLPSGMQFLQYWEKLQPALPSGHQLPSKQPLDRVNKMRVALKHYGTIPSFTAIAQAKADVSTFFTDATQLIFGVDFAAVDMIDLVDRPQTVQVLRHAQTRADAGDFPEAMAGLMIAFTELIDHYTEVRHPGQGPFQFGRTVKDYRNEKQTLPDTGIRQKDRSTGALSRGLGKSMQQLEALTTATQEIQRAMRMISLGIDYARYAQFEVLAPRLQQEWTGAPKFIVTAGHATLTLDDYRFGRLFVIEAALQAAKADAVLQRRNDHQAVNNPAPGVWAGREWRDWTGPSY